MTQFPTMQTFELLAALESIPSSVPQLPWRVSETDTTQSNETPNTENDDEPAKNPLALMGSAQAPRSFQDYRILYSQCSAMGKELKHRADNNCQSKDVPLHVQKCALLDHADSLFLYIYAFLCQDHMHGRIDPNGRSKPIIDVMTWRSIIGYLEFVERKAGHMNWQFLVDICTLSRAMICHRQIQAIRRKMSSPEDKEKHAKHSEEFIQLWTDAETYHTRATASLSSYKLSKQFPKTWKACTVDNIRVQADDWLVLTRPFAFAWPITLSSIGHLVGFAKAILDEWAQINELDWSSWTV